MANKCLNKIEQLDNTKLVDLFKKNGYGEYEEVLQANGTTGKNLLDLKEFEIMRWKLPPVQRRRLWSCLTELKENPEKFLGEPKPEKKHTINRKQSMSNQNSQIKDKLELVIGGGKPFEKSFIKPAVKVSPSSPPTEDYLSMDRPVQDEGELHYDGNGYLLPTGQIQEIEEIDYEPPPEQNKNIGFVPTRYRDIKKPVGHRPPQALPRNESNSGDYISGPENPKIPNTPERREMPKIYPTVKVSHKNITTRKAPSPIKISNLSNNEDEDVEETYEPAPPLKSPTYANQNQSLETQETETLSKKLKGFLLNTLGRRSPYEEHERKWHSLNLKSSRDKSPTDSVKSVEKEVPLQSRPLPPLPWEKTATEPPEIYQNIPENPPTDDRPPSPEVIYSNEELETNLDAQLTQQTKIQPKFQLPQKLPYSYEPHRITSVNNLAKRKLPAPPNTLPTIPLNPNILSHNEDEEDLEEYNNAIFNINDEPYYRNTDRKGSRLLLHDLEDGAFLFRPSRHFFLTLSLKYRGKYCNLGIEKTESNKIRLNTDGDNMSPEFATLTDFVATFTREPLTFQHEGSIVEIRLRRVLPHDRF